MALFDKLTDAIKGKGKRIVFPETNDKRVLGAASRLKQDGLLEPILIGNKEEVENAAEEYSFNIEGLTIYDPQNYPEFDEMADAFVERRKGKATREDADEILKNANYFGTMLVYQDKADGLVSGAVGTTADTVRPALQIVKTRPGANLVSGSFIMVRDSEQYVFADAAINLQPNAEQLAEIAVVSAHTAEQFGMEPRVAMLSYSTLGSGQGPDVELVQEATKLAQEKAPEYMIEGELQFDAAFDETVGQTKAPESDVAGHANVFIFPDLQSGNIGYKIAQRLGGFEAVGPILQGMAKPISDLSRGSNEEDIYKVGITTAFQALENN